MIRVFYSKITGFELMISNWILMSKYYRRYTTHLTVLFKKHISPYFCSHRVCASGMECNGVILADCPAYPTTETLANVYLHFLIRYGITDCPKMALPHAIPAPIAGVEIHPPDILASKHYLVITAWIGNTVRDAILVTIAYRTNIRGFERPDGMEQTFFIQGSDRLNCLGRCDNLEAERVVNFSSQLWICR